MLRMISWNVNGLRAVRRKGFDEWLDKERPDILCLQETKADESQIDIDTDSLGYAVHMVSGDRRGYSGVALFTRLKPRKIWSGLGIERFDREGRVIAADYGDFILFNVYFPNGKQSAERLRYKLDFYDAFLEAAEGFRRQGRGVVACGDFNTAHTERDLARPRENSKVSGFLPEERAWLDRLVEHGYVDTFRMFNDEPGHYTWWDLKTRARERDIGWRIDYFFVSSELRERVKSSFILKEVQGSDHCPIGIELDA